MGRQEPLGAAWAGLAPEGSSAGPLARAVGINSSGAGGVGRAAGGKETWSWGAPFSAPAGGNWVL